MKEFKYTTSFSSILRCIPNEDYSKSLALAALNDLKGIIPEDVKNQESLLCVAGNAFVGNLANKNGHVIDTATTLDIYKKFIHTQLNAEHRRDKICGHIVSAGLSKFNVNYAIGSGSEILAEKDVKDTKSPFNVCLGAVIYKVFSPKLIELIEESNNPNSDNYLAYSYSWELGYDSFVLAVGSMELEECEIIDDPVKIEANLKFLKSKGGNGILPDGRPVFQLLKGEVLPLGIGITESPAGLLKGIMVENTDKLEEDDASTKISSQVDNGSIISNKINSIVYNMIIKELKPNGLISQVIGGETKEIISQLEKPVVINIKSIMSKIKDISEVTDEKLTKGEITAATMREFIEERLKEPMEKIMQEKKVKEGELQAAKTAQEELTKNYETIKTQLETVNKNLEKIQAEAAEKEKLEKYNQRMAHIDEVYELDVDLRKIVASDLQNVDEDGFKKVEEKYKILFKDRNKEVLAKVKTDKEKLEAEAKTKLEAKGSEDTKTIVEDALKNAVKDKTTIANTSTTETPTLLDRAKRAFAIGKDGGISIDVSKRRKI